MDKSSEFRPEHKYLLLYSSAAAIILFLLMLFSFFTGIKSVPILSGLFIIFLTYSYKLYQSRCPFCKSLFTSREIGPGNTAQPIKPYDFRNLTEYGYSESLEKEEAERRLFQCAKCKHKWGVETRDLESRKKHRKTRENADSKSS